MKKDTDVRFTETKLNSVLDISRIITLHYFEYAKNFVFSGEKHNFWELVYVDKGVVSIMSDDKEFTLSQGDVAFHKPNEYHSILSKNNYANVVILTFICKSPAIDFFSSKILKLSDANKKILSHILAEGKEAFNEPLNILNQKRLIKKENPPFGSEQLIKIHLEHLLINLIRENTNSISKTQKPNISKEENEQKIVENIVKFLNENTYKKISLDDVCNNLCFSKSYVKKLFKEKKGIGVMEYLSNIKINEAKKLISDKIYTYTQISEMLSYSSLHYFSHSFKAKTNMSPSEYAKSIKHTALL